MQEPNRDDSKSALPGSAKVSTRPEIDICPSSGNIRSMLFPDTRVKFADEPGSTYTAFEPGRLDSRLDARRSLSNLRRQVRGLKQV